jgi:hypothetical protein
MVEQGSMLKVDLHLHTADDPVDTIRHTAAELVERAAEQHFSALAITLHERQHCARSLADLAREHGIVLIPGVERTIEGRHVVLLNFPQAAESVRTFADLKRLKSRANGLVIAPHPFFPDGSCLGGLMHRHADLFDAVEWSYFWRPEINFNRRAERWARQHGKPLVGNSDLHDLRQLGRTYSLVSSECDADAICDSIREGHVSLRTEPVPPLELAQVFGGMIWRGRVTRAPRRLSAPASGLQPSA